MAVTLSSLVATQVVNKTGSDGTGDGAAAGMVTTLSACCNKILGKRISSF